MKEEEKINADNKKKLLEFESFLHDIREEHAQDAGDNAMHGFKHLTLISLIKKSLMDMIIAKYCEIMRRKTN